jgi:sulfate/thiosulfate transport system ATP-binding protein
MSIDAQHIRKDFGTFAALNDVSLAVPEGKLVALLGPSGSGKTTLLRVIAGLEVPDSGRVSLAGRDVTEAGPGERGIGFVFQHYALFRHMTVAQNVAFGLNVRGRSTRPDKAAIQARVMELLKLMQLDWAAGRYPTQLSGGQRQRVALARALAVEPQVLLLDEPFGALDAAVRQELRDWLRDLHNTLHLTSVFVTHDQQEALEIADQVVVFNEGRIEQIGSPDEVYEHPASPFVYRFLGKTNVLQGEGELHYARPHDIELRTEKGGDFLQARIRHVHLVGSEARIEVQDDLGRVLSAEMPKDQFRGLSVGAGEQVYFRPRRVTRYPAQASEQADRRTLPRS